MRAEGRRAGRDGTCCWGVGGRGTTAASSRCHISNLMATSPCQSSHDPNVGPRRAPQRDRASVYAARTPTWLPATHRVACDPRALDLVACDSRYPRAHAATASPGRAGWRGAAQSAESFTADPSQTPLIRVVHPPPSLPLLRSPPRPLSVSTVLSPSLSLSLSSSSRRVTRVSRRRRNSDRDRRRDDGPRKWAPSGGARRREGSGGNGGGWGVVCVWGGGTLFPGKTLLDLNTCRPAAPPPTVDTFTGP